MSTTDAINNLLTEDDLKDAPPSRHGLRLVKDTLDFVQEREREVSVHAERIPSIERKLGILHKRTTDSLTEIAADKKAAQDAFDARMDQLCAKETQVRDYATKQEQQANALLQSSKAALAALTAE